MHTGAIYSATDLFKIAKTAYERTDDGSPERKGDKQDAIVAIVFSAFSLEAFINELMDLADNPILSDTPTVQSFASLIKEVEKSQGSIKLKYMLTKVVFTDEPFSEGELPYQDFTKLLELRNMLVHYKSKDKFKLDWDGKVKSHSYPKIISKLQSRNILAQVGDNEIKRWTSLISTRATARWACSTACEMVQLVLDIMPDGKLKGIMKPFYAKSFQLIP